MIPVPARAGILAGGNFIVDRVKMIEVWPPEEALALIGTESRGNGGSPYNILKDLAKLGVTWPLAAVGLVGDDVDGRWILDDCRAHGIDARGLRLVEGTPTSYTDVMTVQSTGRRTFFHQKGANALLAPEHFDFRSCTARLFHLGYLLLLGGLEESDEEGRPRVCRVLRDARAAGLHTSIDVVSDAAGRFRQVVVPVLPEVDTLFVNEFEAGRITGIDLIRDGQLDLAATEAAAAALIAHGVRRQVIIHAPRAVHARTAAGQSAWQGSVRLPQAEIRGTAGAGDALATGVLLGIHEDWPLAETLETGVCVAAASLLHPTCSDGIPLLSACRELGRRHGYRDPARG